MAKGQDKTDDYARVWWEQPARRDLRLGANTATFSSWLHGKELEEQDNFFDYLNPPGMLVE